MFPEIESFDIFLEGVILVQGHDVLKFQFLGDLGANFQGADDLASIHAIEEMAVVNQESGSDPAFDAKAHEHQVETEDLHVLDAFATGALHGECEFRAIVGSIDGHAPRRFIQPLRCLFEGEDCFLQSPFPFREIPL